MKALLMAGAALTAVISAGVFAGNFSEQAVEVTADQVTQLESSTLAASPCSTAALEFKGEIKLEKVGKAPFKNFCTKRMFSRAKKIPKEEFIWAIYDMQRSAGKPLTPLNKLTATFNSIDKNKDKFINMKELNGFTGTIKPPVLGVEGCGTCNSRGVGCKAGCHCHSNGSCGKNGDDAGFKFEGGAAQTKTPG